MAEDIVRAKRFEVEDEDGNVRAVLSAGTHEGFVGVALVDDDQETTVFFGLHRRGEKTPTVWLTNQRGASLMISITASGNAVIELENENGNSQLITPDLPSA